MHSYNLSSSDRLFSFSRSSAPDLLRAGSVRPAQLQPRLQALEDLPRPPRVERGKGRRPQEEDHRELDDQDAHHHGDQVRYLVANCKGVQGGPSHLGFLDLGNADLDVVD